MALLIMSFGCEVTPYGLVRTVTTFDNGETDFGPWFWATQARREKIRRIDGRGEIRLYRRA